MSAALARAAAHAKATVLELHNERTARRADVEAAAAAKAEVAAALAQVRNKDAAVAAADAATQSTVSELRALVETQRVQNDDAKSAAAAAAASLSAVLSHRQAAAETAETRIRELQRAFRLRIILCHVDAEDAAEPGKEPPKKATSAVLGRTPRAQPAR